MHIYRGDFNAQHPRPQGMERAHAIRIHFSKGEKVESKIRKYLAHKLLIYILKYDICIPGTPNNQFEMDIGLSNHLCNFRWSHPTETTIKKWMLQVPGIYGIYPPEN